MAGSGSPTPALVSVVMTAWNPRLDWLEQAVASILAETGCPLELVLVDDGSATPIADVLTVSDARLTIVRIPHGGLYQARNAGIAASSGDYVRFVDADDVFPAGGTLRLLALMGGRTDVITYGQTLRCDPLLQPTALMECTTEGDALLECLLGGFPVRHMSMLFPRRLIERVGEWDPAFPACGDWDFVLRALEFAHVRCETGVVTLYRNHPDAMSANLAATTEGMRLVVSHYVQRHPESRGTGLMRKAAAAVELKLAWSNFERRHFPPAGSHLCRATLLDPTAVALSLAQRLVAASRHAMRKSLATLLGTTTSV